MKSIEERYKCNYKECSNECPLYHTDAKMCLQHWAIKFATEQEKIDEEENGKALLYAVHKTTERVKKEMIGKACDAYCITCCGCTHENCSNSNGTCLSYRDYKKAMEE